MPAAASWTSAPGRGSSPLRWRVPGTRCSPWSPRARCSPSAPRPVPASRSRPCSPLPSRRASATFTRGWSSSQMPPTGSAPMPRAPRRAAFLPRTAWRLSSPRNRWTRPSCGGSARCSSHPIRRPGASPADSRTRQFLALAAGPGRPREERFEQRAVLAPEALRRVVRSLSYGGPALGPARLERLLVEVEALGEREGREWARALRLSWLRLGRRSRRTRRRPPRR